MVRWIFENDRFEYPWEKDLSLERPKEEEKGKGDKMSGIFIICLIICLIIMALICIPIAAIWSLNTLFGLGIAYTLKTWAAALVICGIIGGSKK